MDVLEKSQATEINARADFFVISYGHTESETHHEVLKKESSIDLDSSTNLAQAAREGTVR